MTAITPTYSAVAYLRAALVVFVAMAMPRSSDEVLLGADTPLQVVANAKRQGLGPGSVENGRLIYRRRCARCHSADLNGDGPLHRGVVGRPAARVPGFAYSTALKASGLVWDEPTLDRWLADPETLVPGQAMDLQLSNPQARRDVIAYLKTVRD